MTRAANVPMSLLLDAIGLKAGLPTIIDGVSLRLRRVRVDVGVGSWICLIQSMHDWQSGAVAVSGVTTCMIAFDAAVNRNTSRSMATTAWT